jgi:hypothetical protein
MSVNTFINFGSFGILTLLWLGFGAALVFNQALLDSTWQVFRGLPMIAQIGLGLLLLPLVLGLWIWQTPWPLWIRVVLVIGLAWATIYTFLPKQA